MDTGIDPLASNYDDPSLQDQPAPDPNATDPTQDWMAQHMQKSAAAWDGWYNNQPNQVLQFAPTLDPWSKDNQPASGPEGPANLPGSVLTDASDLGQRTEKKIIESSKKAQQQKSGMLGGVDIPASRLYSGNTQNKTGPWFTRFNNGRIPMGQLQRVPGGGYLRPDAAAAFTAMVRAAKQAGHPFGQTDTYRNYASQVQCVKDKGLYGHGGLCATPGTSNHGWGLAVDTKGDLTWAHANAKRFGFSYDVGGESWHMDYIGGFTGKIKGSQDLKTKQPKTRTKRVKVPGSADATNTALATTQVAASAALQAQYEDQLNATEGPTDVHINALTDLYANMPHAQTVRQTGQGPDKGTKSGKQDTGNTPNFGTGRIARIKEQLYNGFMDAGRQDLARMVDTHSFQVWVNAESGWNPAARSPANNQGLANVGLFQFWLGHSFTNQYMHGSHFIATPYEQAKLVARYFNLHANEIDQYAQQIRNGTYVGWG